MKAVTKVEKTLCRKDVINVDAAMNDAYFKLILSKKVTNEQKIKSDQKTMDKNKRENLFDFERRF